ncbi:hypothetical protein HYE68_003601 [Fusarium pseudograminearum]|nr:hypothetical protein HYE68_003601 [Fusarium pseudograminearum]
MGIAIGQSQTLNRPYNYLASYWASMAVVLMLNVNSTTVDVAQDHGEAIGSPPPHPHSDPNITTLDIVKVALLLYHYMFQRSGP